MECDVMAKAVAQAYQNQSEAAMGFEIAVDHDPFLYPVAVSWAAVQYDGHLCDDRNSV
jgi:hypothetical protein